MTATDTNTQPGVWPDWVLSWGSLASGNPHRLPVAHHSHETHTQALQTAFPTSHSAVLWPLVLQKRSWSLAACRQQTATGPLGSFSQVTVGQHSS